MTPLHRLRVPSGDRAAVRGSKTITWALIERIISRAYAAIAFAFGALAISPAFAGQPLMNQTWAWIFGIALFGGLAGSALAGAMGRRVRTAAGVVAVAYLLMVISWPFAAASITAVQPGTPWLWGVCNVAMAAAVVSFGEWLAGIYILVTSTAWCLIRLTPAGGHAGLERALQDAGYVFILGVAVLLVAVVLRRTAADVDHQVVTATARYGLATREHEIEKQRVTVDALLHDSVMTTLLHVSRADTERERRLAARMAIKSLNVIADTEEQFDSHHAPNTADDINVRLRQLQTELGVPVTLHTCGPSEHVIPHAVAETMFSAAMQALVNSTQHAGPTVTERTVAVEWSDVYITVTVTDDGQGFDPAVTSDRLGVRVSIVERMEAVGGTAVIESAPGEGVRVTLTWILPAPPQSGPTSPISAASL